MRDRDNGRVGRRNSNYEGKMMAVLGVVRILGWLEMEGHEVKEIED